jgi:hypothetical protein
MSGARPSWMRAFDALVEQYLVSRATRWEPAARAPTAYGDASRYEALEQTKLLHADPVFVSAELCDLVELAATAFKPEPLAESDLMTPVGFLLFERPIDVLRGDRVRVPCSGFSWAELKARGSAAAPYALNLTFYADFGMGSDPVAGIEWTFGTDGSTSDNAPLLRLVHTTFRLMQEWRPARRDQRRPDRGSRRAAQRAGLHERDVLVVHLRRTRLLAEPSGGSANYSHRFLVSGHWRNQWCPSISAHRQTWISPYVKGPADKPLLPKHGRAFVLNR